MARLDGDELAADPARLVEEATTIPLFGGRRAVWVRSGSRNFGPALEALMASATPDCRVVIEAGDLAQCTAAQFCERAANAVALPCYADTERASRVSSTTRCAQPDLTITAEARTALVPLLGGNQLGLPPGDRKLALLLAARSP